jgi:TRAP-type C4-dicarboxylate transport system permease small subunit
MNKILIFFDKIEKTIMVITFIIMVIAIFGQVVNRNFLYLPASWLEELAVYCMVYMALLGTELGLRDDTQIRVTMLIDRLSGRARKIVNIISKIVVVSFSVVIFKTSVDMLQMQITTGQISSALQIPMVIPYAAIPVSFGIIIIVQGATLLTMFMEFNKQDSHLNGGK